MALASDTVILEQTESFSIKLNEQNKTAKTIQFTTPKVALNHKAMTNIDFEV
jgi:hypothetical protein